MADDCVVPDSDMRGSESPTAVDVCDPGHGHYFTKKTFHKPTYCHHCTDMLWGLIGQGYVCEGKCHCGCEARTTVALVNLLR